MTKYKVWVTVWSDEFQQQVKKVAGEFDNYMNAKLFAGAYKEYFSTAAEIIESK